MACLARALLKTFLARATAREEELGMTRRRKVLPARRKNTIDDSLLIRSAESLGRMIGSLQRQLDAARRLAVSPGDDGQRDGEPAERGNGDGHTPTRARTGVNAKTKRAKSTAVDGGAAGATRREAQAKSVRKAASAARATLKRRSAKTSRRSG
jgi:hypothetical protein